MALPRFTYDRSMTWNWWGSGARHRRPNCDHAAGALAKDDRSRFRTGVDLDPHDPVHGNLVYVVKGIAHSIHPDVHLASGGHGGEGATQFLDRVAAVDWAQEKVHFTGTTAGRGTLRGDASPVALHFNFVRAPQHVAGPGSPGSFDGFSS